MFLDVAAENRIHFAPTVYQRQGGIKKNSKGYFFFEKNPLTKKTFEQMLICAATLQIPGINMLKLKCFATAVFLSKAIFLSMMRSLPNKQMQSN